jgi:hypothetical protein
MKYEAYENVPHGWEVMDRTAVPVRTFVVGLTEDQAKAVAKELNDMTEALHKTAVILKTQEKNLGTVGLSVLALAQSKSKGE